MSLSKSEQQILKEVIARLKCEPKVVYGVEYPREADEVKEALRGPAKLYLDSWVIPCLEMMLPGEGRNIELAARLAR